MEVIFCNKSSLTLIVESIGLPTVVILRHSLLILVDSLFAGYSSSMSCFISRSNVGIFCSSIQSYCCNLCTNLYSKVVNHKRIGLYYCLSTYLFGLSGTILSVLMRIEL